LAEADGTYFIKGIYIIVGHDMPEKTLVTSEVTAKGKIKSYHQSIFLKTVFSFLIFVSLILIGNSSVHAATNYYVSTTGDDSYNGLYATYQGGTDGPWRTIQKAADTMVGSDTVYIRGGTYNERVSVWYRYNIDGPYITFTNFSGEEVILDGTGIDIAHGEGLFHIQRTDFVRVSGLQVQNSNAAGIEGFYANNLMIDNNRTYNTVTSGISAWAATNVVIENNEIEYANNGGSEENLTIDSSSNVEVRNNYVHDSAVPAWGGGQGINIKNGSYQVRVHHNIVDNSFGYAYGVDAWTAHTYDIKIYNNIACNTTQGFILESEQGGLAEDLWVYNNIAYGMTYSAYEIPNWGSPGPKKDLYFINNTGYDSQYGMWIRETNLENIVVRNNIFSENTSDPQIVIIEGVDPADLTIDHNLFHGPGAPVGSDYVIGDPLFVDPTGADFHLQSASPAIDAGSLLDAPNYDFDHNTRPQGAGYDIGAYEYVPLTVTIDQAHNQPDPTRSSPINFTVVFSEPVSDFAKGDVTLSGTAGATTAIVSGSEEDYNVAVSGMTNSGTVIASIAAGVATGPTGKTNEASTSTDNVVFMKLIGVVPPPPSFGEDPNALLVRSGLLLRTQQPKSALKAERVSNQRGVISIEVGGD
jgi:hypothetical protein